MIHETDSLMASSFFVMPRTVHINLWVCYAIASIFDPKAAKTS